MSLILDALKKSERERLGKPSSAPLVTRPRHLLPSRNRRQSRQKLMLALSALVLVMGISTMIAWWMLGQQDDSKRMQPHQLSDRQVAPPEVSPLPPVSSVPVRMKPQESSPIAEQRVPVEQIPEKQTPQPVETVQTVAEVVEVTPEAVVESNALLPEASVVPIEEAEEPQQQALKTLRQLPSSLRNRVKPIHLDVHVYDRRQSRRFVYINSILYSEGARMKNGVEIIEIVPAGVVMQVDGEQFLLTVND